jgi:hypothetical protein
MGFYVRLLPSALIAGDLAVVLGFSAIFAAWYFRVPRRTVPSGQLITVAGSPVAWLTSFLLPTHLLFWVLLVVLFAMGVISFRALVLIPQ